MAAPPIYPELQGLTFDFVRRPMWSTNISKHTSGRQTRIGYYEGLGPIYEWDLRYDMLRDYRADVIESELKRLEGFYLQQQARLTGFLFRDPDDWYVTGQVLSPSDDTGTRFRLVRTYGDVSYGAASTEPIGWVNLNAPFKLYLNGIQQDVGTYTVHQEETVPVTWDGSDIATLDPSFADWPTTSLPYASVGNQIIEIPSAPGGATVTVDMQYFFYVRFGDDTVDFENFARQLWELKKVTLHSLRRELAVPDFSVPIEPPPEPGSSTIESAGTPLSTTVSFAEPARSISLTTTQTNTIILLHIVINQEGDAEHRQDPFPSVSSVSGAGLTWTRRSSTGGRVVNGYLSGDILVASETWWALAPAALTAAPVTINTSSDLAFMLGTAVAVHGVNTASPFDPNGSLPSISTHLSGGATSPNAGVTTSNANDIVLFFNDVFSTHTPPLPAPSGLTSIASTEAVQSFIGLTVATDVSSKLVSAVTSETLTSATTQTAWIATADALQAA